MIQIIQILLIPFSWIYGGIMAFRNFMYANALLKSHRFKVPTLGVGNLSVGGTGKTPHVKLFLNYFLNEGVHTAVLSRGYGRRSSGFILVDEKMSPERSGDEPLEIKQEFPDSIVAVCESRVEGMRELMKLPDPPSLVILDDAFQHRSLQVDHHILLTTWNRPYFSDFVLPAGRLREFRCGKRRALTVITTKCPEGLMSKDIENFKSKLKLSRDQSVFFSTNRYSKLYHLGDKSKTYDIKEQETTCLLLTGIANPEILISELNSRFQKVESILFPDHHNYSQDDIRKLKSKFDKMSFEKKIVVTTLKDATKLKNTQLPPDLPVYIQETDVLIQNSEDWLSELKKSLLERR